MLSSHTQTHTPRSTATTSSLPFHQSNDKVDCPYLMLAGSRHYINLVIYNYEINKIIKDGLPTLKGIVSLWNISSERNLEMHLLHNCQLPIYSGFSSIFLQKTSKGLLSFFNICLAPHVHRNCHIQHCCLPHRHPININKKFYSIFFL